MRTSLLVAVSFAFVVSSAVVARSQEVDVTLINDVETSPAKNAEAKRKVEKDLRVQITEEVEEKPEQAAAKEGDGQVAATALPATLDEALAKALRSNPEVLLAEATVRQAQAEYNQAKLKAVQDVTVAFQQWNALKEKRKYDQKLHEKGYVGALGLEASAFKQAESEAKLAYLLGVGAESHPEDSSVRKVITTPMGLFEQTYVHVRNLDEGVSKRKDAADKGAVEKRPEIPEKYRKVLQKPMKVKFAGMPLAKVIDQLNEATGDELPILRQTMWQFDLTPLNVELTQELPLQAVLEMVADLTGCVFIFRDYGLLVAPRNSPFQYPRAASIPEGAAGF